MSPAVALPAVAELAERFSAYFLIVYPRGRRNPDRLTTILDTYNLDTMNEAKIRASDWTCTVFTQPAYKEG